MAEPGKERDAGKVTQEDLPSRRAASPERNSKTEGTNRDFDDKGDSRNQGHGHPREERGQG